MNSVRATLTSSLAPFVILIYDSIYLSETGAAYSFFISLKFSGMADLLLIFAFISFFFVYYATTALILNSAFDGLPLFFFTGFAISSFELTLFDFLYLLLVFFSNPKLVF